MAKSFSPSWWCPGPHSQTIAARFFRTTSKFSYQRKRLELSDGDFIDLDFATRNSKNPMVIILHGLEGSSDAPYIKSLVSRILISGWNALAVNFRSCSGEPNRHLQSYHSGFTQDLNFIVESLQGKYPHLFLVGYSIGGNVALKWLGEEGHNVLSRGLRAAATVSVPYDLERAVEILDRGFNKHVYTANLLHSLKKKSRQKLLKFPDAFSIRELESLKTFREFDSIVTAPVHGFRDARDYWKSSSAKFFLEKVRIPTLLIHAADDPFFPGELLPMQTIKDSVHIKLRLERQGGHLGFVAGRSPWHQEPWLEDQILEFLKQTF